MSNPISVVVIGGGYAGVMAANRLTSHQDLTVTLLNPRPRFVDRIRLHEHVARGSEAELDFARILNPRVRLDVGSATRIDSADRMVELEDGDALPYDYLVYAVGSTSAAPRVPGAAEHALPLAGLEQARRLREALLASPDALVTVVGAGPTGIELAAELAESGRRVTLLCGTLLAPSLHTRGRDAVAQRLADLGVTVLQGDGTEVIAVDAHSVTLADGRTIPSGITAWATGFGVPELARRSGLATDAAGRLLTDETLTSIDAPRIVATGDAASPSDAPYRMSCQAAMQLGPQAAETVLSRIDGRAPRPVEVAFAGQCLSLGRRGGLFQVSGRDDVPTPLVIRSRGGAALKRTICGSIRWELAMEARHPGAFRWWLREPARGNRVADVQHDATIAMLDVHEHAVATSGDA
ncbi:FAD-dependent oxidoreductase [Amnibacterium sp. CER49]|uniref:NAD(P)/FAD-dependent oxidoreductase n=1 Tax=Amnibacterium sp. CER49 TaxID=3039161 RepID=UPI00244D453D|nr:FAD-dependent oxidoreductase [Amnibacterium sp. CER49]MDH2444536.1 FAD-dependent oxidoreductase [Amnibacterium sp. CER49]